MQGVTTLVPKNGRYLVAMLVGAFPDRARELRDGLAKHRGIYVQHHIDPQRGPRALKMARLPEDVDLAIVILSQQDDGLSNRFKMLLERYRIQHGTELPVIRCEHKWTALSVQLQNRYGISQCPPLPDDLLRAPYFKAPHERPKREEELRIPLAKMARFKEPEPEPRLDPKVYLPPAPPPPPAPLPPPAVVEEVKVAEPPAPALVVPEPVAPSPAPDPVQAEQDLRRRFLRTDTLALIRELQARMPLAGIKSMLVTATDIQMEMAPIQSLKSPAEERSPLSAVS